MTNRMMKVDSFLNYKGEGYVIIEFAHHHTVTLTLEDALFLWADLRQEIDDVQTAIKDRQDEKDLQG